MFFFGKPCDRLTINDLLKYPVWEFLPENRFRDETWVRPVKTLPIETLSGRIIGSEVSLNNGKRVWAMMSNISLRDPKQTNHFLSISINHERRWIHLARYFDVDFDSSGPEAFAASLELPLDQVFPISYDITHIAIGDPDVLRGSILTEPRERLTRKELISMSMRSQ